MDTETSQAFAKVLAYAANSIGDMIQSNGTDTNDYIAKLGNKIVAYRQSIALLWIAIAGIAIVVGVAMVITGIVKSYECTFYMGLIVIFLAMIVGIYNAYTYIACQTFPEKVILDYVKSIYDANR